MKTRNSISAFWGLDLSTFSESQNLGSKGRLVMRGAVIILVAVLFLSVLAFAQEDTLILLGSNTEMYHSYAVSAYNKNAFVTDADHGLRVINYSDPYNPYTVTRYTEWAVDIEIRDSLAYYTGDGALYIRDISDPLESEIIGWCTGEWWDHVGFKVHLFDTLALVMHTTAFEDCFLKIIDISDPTNPQVLSTVIAPPYSTIHWGDAYKKDNYVYWADHAYIDLFTEVDRIIVLDITDPSQPVHIVSDTCLRAKPRAIWIKDNYAYVAEDYGGRGLVVLDISDPYNIDSVGCFPTPEGRAWNVYIKGNYAYVCAHLQPALDTDRLYVLDITDPTNPYLIASYDTPYSPKDVFVDAPYVLVADYSSLLVFEASFLKNIPGDVNADRQVDLGDVLFLVSYLYKQGSAPEPIERGDVNGDCVVDLGDVLYLISYLYKGGSVPQSGCAL